MMYGDSKIILTICGVCGKEVTNTNCSTTYEYPPPIGKAGIKYFFQMYHQQCLNDLPNSRSEKQRVSKN